MHIRQKYMRELIHERRETGYKGHQDLFSGLLAASGEENGELSDSDLMGNIFVFMIAGHEVCHSLHDFDNQSSVPRLLHILYAILSSYLHCIPRYRRNCTNILKR